MGGKMKNKAAQKLGKLGGLKKSPAKTAAARANAKKPRKKKVDDREIIADLFFQLGKKTEKMGIPPAYACYVVIGIASYIIGKELGPDEVDKILNEIIVKVRKGL